MRTGLAALLGAVMALAVVPLTAAAQEEPEQEIIVKFREGASRSDALEKSRTRAVADATDGAEVLASRDAVPAESFETVQRPWHVVGLPYICTAVAAIVWPIVLGPPRRTDRDAEDG